MTKNALYAFYACITLDEIYISRVHIASERLIMSLYNIIQETRWKRAFDWL